MQLASRINHKKIAYWEQRLRKKDTSVETSATRPRALAMTAKRGRTAPRGHRPEQRSALVRAGVVFKFELMAGQIRAAGQTNEPARLAFHLLKIVMAAACRKRRCFAACAARSPAF
jgi:hypothetical protein